MGNALRRFQAIQDENSVFRFQIDTSKIDPLATDGSENPLTFRIPCSAPNAGNSCVIKVSDGRPDIVINAASTAANLTLTFSVSGIYDITIIGRLGNFNTYVNSWGYDRLKFGRILKWGGFKLGARTFYNCNNLIIDAPDTVVLPSDASTMFQGVKEFTNDLSLLDTSKVTSSANLFNAHGSILKSLLNPFWSSLSNFNLVYTNLTLDSSISKIQIISDSITSLSQPFNSLSTSATLELDIQTPNLTTMFRVLYNGAVKARSHAGKIDVRNVTNTDQWLNGTLTKAQVDATLLGWAQLPFMQSGVTWNWNGSKYSNNPAVIAAYNKITSDWGVIFTNLTME